MNRYLVYLVFNIKEIIYFNGLINNYEFSLNNNSRKYNTKLNEFCENNWSKLTILWR